MNRRKAIKRIVLFTGVGVASYGAIDYFIFQKTPNLNELDKNRELIEALAETIIPATDTPGASDAKVHDFIILMINDCSYRNTQIKFIDGLNDIKSYCNSKFEKPFATCSIKQKTSILRHFEEKSSPYFSGILGKIQTKLFGQSFFSILKDLTIKGYCTSMPGATQGLAYVLIPGRYTGCSALEPNQKSWATK